MPAHPYATLDYALCSRDLGEPIFVDDWGAPLAVRPLPTSQNDRDATGLYPLTPLRPIDLRRGLEYLRGLGLVSVSFVLDPTSEVSIDALRDVFASRFVPYKTHYLLDFRQDRVGPDKETRRKIRRALERVRIERVNLADHLATWMELYAALMRTHRQESFLPSGYFERLAALPGVECWAALQEARMVAMVIVLGGDGVFHGHLAGCDEMGRTTMAQFALYDAIIEDIARRPDARIFALGSNAGAQDDPASGLARFKRLWSNRQAPAYFCGQILDESRYARFSVGRSTDWFPAYRAP